MNSVRVKICGVTSQEDLQFVIEAGADAIGCVINAESSPRNISLDLARAIFQKAPPFLTTVAVIVVDNPRTPIDLYNQLKPDVLQLHAFGHYAQEIRTQLPSAKIIAAVPADANAVSIVNQNKQYFDAFLLDTATRNMHGGTGKTHDWSLSKRIRETITPYPLILAGGLTPHNVHKAVRIVQPFAVDVASGVELSPGKKDRLKVYNFVQNARGGKP